MFGLLENRITAILKNKRKKEIYGLRYHTLLSFTDISFTVDIAHFALSRDHPNQSRTYTRVSEMHKLCIFFLPGMLPIPNCLEQLVA